MVTIEKEVHYQTESRICDGRILATIFWDFKGVLHFESFQDCPYNSQRQRRQNLHIGENDGD